MKLVPVVLCPAAYSYDALIYAEWCHYKIGFTGHGPTAFDQEPAVPKPELPEHVAALIDGLFAEEASTRRKVWASVTEGL